KRFRMGLEPSVIEDLWDPSELLPILWGLIPRKVRIDNFDDKQIEALAAKRTAVICTFPKREVKDQYLEEGYLSSFLVYECDYKSTRYFSIYNGLPDVPWVRQTIFPGKSYT